MKQLKKVAAVFIAFFLVLSSLDCVIHADSGWDGVTEIPCTEGTGDPDNPYLISTPEQLAWFRTQVKTDNYICAKLTADINLNNQPWTPIGGDVNETPMSLQISGNPFRGIFDGNGHTISGLNISIVPDNSNYRYIGLFGAAAGTRNNKAEINNLTVQGNITVTAADTDSVEVGSIAGICGCGAYLSISNCVSKVNIELTGTKGGTQAAGIVGYAVYPVDIIDCVNMGDINGVFKSVGGILGFGRVDNSIRCCCNMGNITGTVKVGGLAGTVSGEIVNCYNAGCVTALSEDGRSEGSGGLFGVNSAGNDLNVNNCFNVGTCNFSFENYTGGIYGNISANDIGEVSFNNVYFLTGTCPRVCGRYAEQYYEDDPNPLYECYKTISVTNAQISSDEFVAELNNNSGSVVFKKGSDHPIFVWQQGEEPVLTLGDIDGNGSVNSTDVSELIHTIVNNQPIDLAVADINHDGSVNSTDVSELIALILK